MKYVVLLGDGMSDAKLEKLGGKTPLQAARTPHMDFLAQRGKFGLVRTVPEGLPPGSDVANLSVFGYDPRSCYTGRSPLEAISMGVDLGPEDVAFRVNLVTLMPQRTGLVMQDYSAGHITSEEAKSLVEDLQKTFGNDEFHFFPGVGYRHLLVWKNGRDMMKTVPPHDITGRDILDFLPKGDGQVELVNLMNSSQMLFHNHPVNVKRKEDGKLPANSIWLWGQGKTPRIAGYREKFGLTGAVISAVDLIKGIGVCAGLDIINVPGATGYIDTNYEGKAAAALSALDSRDFVYLHVEAPDEAGHSGNMEHKIQAIEDFDARVVGPVLEGIRERGEFRVLCLPDHPTPLALMTHTADPVPFVLYGGEKKANSGIEGYDEFSAQKTGVFVEEGFRLMEMMLKS